MSKQETAAAVKAALKKKANTERRDASMWFFKTEKGQYGAHDEFIGVTVPDQRKVAKEHRTLPLKDVATLLKSKIHEHRLTALFILLGQMKRGTEAERDAIAKLYLQNLAHINNWDLVDASAHYILGPYYEARDRQKLYTLARSRDLWKRRVAIITTFWFIRQDDFDDTLAIAEMLLTDSHDLIHKAVGWMLREVGKRNQKLLEQFLKQQYKTMPRTMLRYAIEKFPEAKRQKYLKGTA